MSDEERKRRALALQWMVNECDGFKLLAVEIEDRIRLGWEKFIDLPVGQKTGKKALEHQAAYRVLKDLREWIDEEIRGGLAEVGK